VVKEQHRNEKELSRFRNTELISMTGELLKEEAREAGLDHK
jgi:hypothetical protein